MGPRLNKDADHIKKTEGDKKQTLEVVVLVTPLIISLIGLLVNISGIVDSPSWNTFLKIMAWVAFIGFGILVLLIQKRLAIAPFWRTISLILFFLLSGAFFTWFGSWFIPPQVLEDSRTFTIEMGAPIASTYQGVDFANVQSGTANTWTQTSLANGHVITTYEISYDLPNSDSFAGIDLYFQQPIDISQYNYLELKIRFEGPNGRLRIVMKESEQIYNDVILGDGNILAATTQDQNVRLDLAKFFPTVNHKSIRKIDLDASGYFVTGKHWARISEIRFTK
jgi:hypothetical protein